MPEPLAGEARRIYIVSATRAYREALANVLASRERLAVVGGAGSLEDIVRDVDGLRPDVVLVDMSTGDVRAVRVVTGRRSQPKVVAIGLPEMELAFLPCAEAGIAGYVQREASLDEVVRAIEAVAPATDGCTAGRARRRARRSTPAFASR
jgi:two-component system nitrate/nitrite response regulator NarL